MKSFELTSGTVMPGLGLGTWKSDPGVVGEAVKAALTIGYRHIDCAAIYGNEAEIGAALCDVFKEGSIKRGDVFITSKLWCTNMSPEDVEPALRKTLEDLQLDFLDLYLIHWPVVLDRESEGLSVMKYHSLEDKPICKTWEAMEKCVDKGLVKNIGVSNFSKKKLQELIPVARIKPAVNQVEGHPYLQQKELLTFCKETDVHLTAYSPLGSMDRPAFLKNDAEKPILEDSTIASIAKKHSVTPAQVVLAWALHRGTSTIPKSTNPSRIKQNLEAAEVKLTDEDMEQIGALDKHARYISGSHWLTEGSPYTLANLWDE